MTRAVDPDIHLLATWRRTDTEVFSDQPVEPSSPPSEPLLNAGIGISCTCPDIEIRGILPEFSWLFFKERSELDRW
jgi:hypothetical protein